MEREHKRHLLKKLVLGLHAEGGTEPVAERRIADLQTSEELWNEFRALVNTRPPVPADGGWLALQDELLEGLISEMGIASIDDAKTSSIDPRMRLWRGDITTLGADAIVNAANSQMLGCWIPGHHCIDNAIHTFAGVQLRLECARIMSVQGHEEPTGQAKLTGAYNLPAAHVIHTVGPIADGHPSDLHRRQLAACYRSCLDLASGAGLKSIAFCCVSTGAFGFPQQEAAEIAVQTVQAWLDRHGAEMAVIFNVFTDVDETAYRKLLA
ncbi:protein-ADP-ribose hydrolase [Olsenella uli]|uniref:protein-ADP-ribose hydrolase n=1 Tax=Olsenella uli TaxID=133926 RepID=UPI0024A9FA30|nr:protein-ADP-ribose hydrolase [Olsenella uli]